MEGACTARRAHPEGEGGAPLPTASHRWAVGVPGVAAGGDDDMAEDESVLLLRKSEERNRPSHFSFNESGVVHDGHLLHRAGHEPGLGILGFAKDLGLIVFH